MYERVRMRRWAGCKWLFLVDFWGFWLCPKWVPVFAPDVRGVNSGTAIKRHDPKQIGTDREPRRCLGKGGRAKNWGSLFILPGLALFSGVTLKSNHLCRHRNRSFSRWLCVTGSPCVWTGESSEARRRVVILRLAAGKVLMKRHSGPFSLFCFNLKL